MTPGGSVDPGDTVRRADALMHRGYVESADRFEDAIALYEAALAAIAYDTPDPLRGRIHANLAEAYRMRAGGEKTVDLERAVQHAGTAVLEFRRAGDARGEALALLNLAAALAQRDAGDRVRNRADSKAALQRILTLVTAEEDPGTWGRAQLNLGHLYGSDLDVERIAENRETAVAHFRSALEALSHDRWPRDRALAHYDLGVLLEGAGELGGAREQFHRALEIFTPDRWPADCARVLCALGDLDDDVDAYRRALLLYDARRHPRERRDALYRLSELHAGRGEWQAADRCCTRALELSARLWQDLRTPAGRSVELAATNRLHAHAAFVALRRGDIGAAVERLEQGRGRRLTTDEEPLRLADLVALAPADGALVLPLVTPSGGAVFVIRSGCQGVGEEAVVHLPDFTHARLEGLLAGEAGGGGWVNATFAWQNGGATEDFQTAIDATCERLWTSLMGPVHERLVALGVESGAGVVVIPHGALALLPLHAAWRTDAARRRSFLDDWTVSFAPGARVLRACLARHTPSARVPELLAVANPTGDLPFAHAECKAVRQMFGALRARLLEGDAATCRAVLEHAAAAPTHVHFACHGLYHWSNVERSGLELADGDLTLERLEDSVFDPDATRLVTLSACDTGIAEVFRRVEGNVFTWNADEFEGLPLGFLRAGAQAVISSLWPVDDCATALLMERFYRSHVRDGAEVAEALRAAQRWLRDLDRDAVLERIRALPGDAAAEVAADIEALDRGARPFEHPFYWAAFIATGAA